MRRLVSSLFVAVLGGVLAACGNAAIHTANNPTCDGGNLKDCDSRCGSGEARACYRLGWFHEQGDEVPRNVKKALELYVKACDGHMFVACRALGFLYGGGGEDVGVEPNKKLAADYYARACAGGITAACYTPPTMVSGSEPKSGGGSTPPPPVAPPGAP